MKDRAHENLIKLLRRFMEEPEAQEAQEDIQAGERWLDAYPAPQPPSRVIAAIRREMALSAHRRHRIVVRLIHTSAAAAAAIAVLALIGQLGPRPVRRPHALHVAFIPTAIWESDDLTTDDLDLAYYSAEIRQIEAQMHALEAGDSDVSGNDASEELEMELLAIQADFWKG